jgi:hypothetical protein
MFDRLAHSTLQTSARPMLLAAVLGAALAAVACGESSATGPSSSGAHTPSGTAAQAQAGGASLSVSGALTASLGSPHCYSVGSIHAIDATGTTGDGTQIKLTVTDERGGKAELLTGTTLYVFTGSGGTLRSTGSTATFSSAQLRTLSGSSTVTVDGTLNC